MAKKTRPRVQLPPDAKMAPQAPAPGLVSRIKGVQLGPTAPKPGSMLIEKRRKPK